MILDYVKEDLVHTYHSNRCSIPQVSRDVVVVVMATVSQSTITWEELSSKVKERADT